MNRKLPGPARSLTRPEIMSIMSHIRISKYWRRDRCLIYLMLELGVRHHEISKVQVKHLFKDADTLLEPYASLSQSGMVALHEWLEELRQWLGKKYGPDTYVAAGRKSQLSTPITRQHVWHIVSKAANSAGLHGRVVPMSFLKTRAIRLAQREGLDLRKMFCVLRKIQIAMGQKSLLTTMEFLGSLEEELCRGEGIDDVPPSSMPKVKPQHQEKRYAS